MRQTLVPVHTVAPLVADFDRLCRVPLVTNTDGWTIGDGKPGKHTTKFQNLYLAWLRTGHNGTQVFPEAWNEGITSRGAVNARAPAHLLRDLEDEPLRARP